MIAELSDQHVAAYQEEISAELQSILHFWQGNMVDSAGGFYGSLDNQNQVLHTAPKGIVLNSRILWTFSAAYNHFKDPALLDVARRAYQYIVDHFIDRKHGGVYWSVDAHGAPLDSRKQIYGVAFAIYGLTEYFRASGENMALHLSGDLYSRIEQHSYDLKHGGYFEAFTQGWKLKEDMRLSDKDDNEKKTMNTHLHVIEAYANLYSVNPSALLKSKIAELLDVFDRYIINHETAHLNLFMDEGWNVRSSLVSYGHDIEAAWLLQACAETIRDHARIERFKQLSISIANAAMEGLDADGGLWYEFDPVSQHLVREKHSWPQAEAMVGFFHVYELTRDDSYLQHSVNSWEFVKKYLRDDKGGEWFWGIDSSYNVMNKEKAGFWKCPYHNSRACLEIVKRIRKMDMCTSK